MNETVSLPQLPPWAQEIQDKADAEDRAEADDLTSEEAASPAPDNVSPILNKLSLSDAAQTRLSADDYVALLEARPKDAFNKWKLLYNARARCGFNDELEECTEAIYELFGDAKDDSTKAAIVKEFYDAGLGNVYREVLSETDFFDENPAYLTAWSS